MKKILLGILVLSILFSLVSCGSEKQEKANEEIFTPLFRFTVAEESVDRIRLFSLSRSEGFFYVYPISDEEFGGGFVSPSRSVSSESVVTGKGSLDFIHVKEKALDRMTLLTSDGIRHALLKENGSETKALPEGIDFQNALFYDELSLIAEKEGLLVLCPVDFAETFVLADTARLISYSRPLAVTHEKSRIWYTLSEGEGYSGIAFFEYGKNTPMGTENFSFDEFSAVGDSAVLFTRSLSDGGALYLFRDLETDEVRSVTVNEKLLGMTCDPEGRIFCGTDGERVYIYDGQTGKRLGAYDGVSGQISPGLAVDEKGETLLLAFGFGKEAVLATLDLKAY